MSHQDADMLATFSIILGGFSLIVLIVSICEIGSFLIERRREEINYLSQLSLTKKERM